MFDPRAADDGAALRELHQPGRMDEIDQHYAEATWRSLPAAGIPRILFRTIKDYPGLWSMKQAL